MGASAEPIDYQARLKQALLAMQKMRIRLEALERQSTEPIAIIGLGCRLPGGATSPEKFWQLLRNGVDAVCEVPPDRWPIDQFYDPDPDVPGKMSTRWGGFLTERVDQFDPLFFSITPREAQKLDPQQRLLLEVTWEAVERAGYAPDKLIGQPVGVFVGISTGDYYHSLISDMASIDAYVGTGTAWCVASGRLSYLLGVHGPSFSVDTACSSSLLAVHLACQSIHAGECDLALAGGVNLMLSPEVTINFSKAHMMAPDGRCKAFDASANGYVRGEGCGVILLKRLSSALADGDPIVAVIRGSATNQDGRSNGLTAPNGPAQEAVLRQALASGGVQPQHVSYVETHGTGTSLGDPIEVQALGAVLCEGRSPQQPLKIGSVKTNIGHLEAGAGIAGVIKTALALSHGEIPPHLHFTTPNPYIPWEQLPIEVPTSVQAWEPIEGRRLAGVSSFGFSGTNVHLVLEEPPVRAAVQPEVDRPLHVLTLSAKSEAAVQQLAQRYAQQLAAQPNQPLADVCFTANAGRAHLEQRLAVIGATSIDLQNHLAAFLPGEDVAQVLHTPRKRTRRPKIAFLFTGQGAQYAAMGRQLYETQPTYRRIIDECHDLLKPQLAVPLRQVLFGSAADTALLDQTAYTQPALFAVEYALAQLWRSWGVEPAVVLGHSIGEYVAACVAGMLDAKDALQLVAARGRLMQALPAGGAMAAVFASVEQVQKMIAPYRAQLDLAGINAPDEIAISGASAAIEAVLSDCKAAGLKAWPLRVSHAFHSPLMEPMLAEYERVCATVTYRVPQLKLISNLTGELLKIAPDAAYWRQQVRSTVQFVKSIETLQAEGCDVLVEAGPHPVLSGLARRSWREADSAYLSVPTLRKEHADWDVLLTSLGTLYTHGVDPDWVGFDRDYTRRRVPLPTYPFQRKTYWVEKRPWFSTQDWTVTRPIDPTAHPLLGQRVATPLKDIVYEAELSLAAQPWWGDHRVYQTAILPAACYLELAAAAARQLWPQSTADFAVKDLLIQEAFVWSETGLRTLQVIISPTTAGGTFKIYSRTAGPDDDWTLHASGSIQLGVAESIGRPMPRVAAHHPIDLGDYYDRVRANGIEYGSSFRAVESAWCEAGEALGWLQLPEVWSSTGQAYAFHPILLDAGLQLLGTLQWSEQSDDELAAYVPLSVEQLRLYQPPTARLWCQATARPSAVGHTATRVGDVAFYDEAGHLIAEMQGVLARRVARTALAQTDHWLYQVVWRPADLERAPEPQAKAGHWVILADRGGVGAALADRLQALGLTCEVRLATDQTPARADFKRLLTAAAQPVAGIVNLWPLDVTPTEAWESIQTGTRILCASTLHLSQAIDELAEAKEAKVWLITRGAQRVREQEPYVSPAQAALWGLGRVIALEQPQQWGGVLDLEAGQYDPCGEADWLVAALLQPDRETQQARRSGLGYVARLARYQCAAEAATITCREDGTYLITGGLGGLGLLTAEWLVAHGARHLVLVGRQGVAAAAQSRLQKLEQQGAQVQVVAADVSQREAVINLLANIAQTPYPLRGVIHAAGVLDDGVLTQQTSERFERVLSPKAWGAWHLADLTRELLLDFWVGFSSAAALMGSPGQANYAAANAFLDAVAWQRQLQGQAAISINWGPWSDVGMAAAQQREQRAHQAGLSSISPDQGLQVLNDLLSESRAQVLVLPVEWSQFAQRYDRTPSPAFLSEVLRAVPRRKATNAAAAFDGWLTRLKQAHPAEQLRLLEDLVRTQGMSVLGLAPDDVPGPQQRLFELGLDSLMAVELKNRLQSVLDVVLPSTIVFEYPSVAALTGYLAQALKIDQTATVETTAPEDDHLAAVAAQLEDLSDEEMEALLLQKLETMTDQTDGR